MANEGEDTPLSATGEPYDNMTDKRGEVFNDEAQTQELMEDQSQRPEEDQSHKDDQSESEVKLREEDRETEDDGESRRTQSEDDQVERSGGE